MSLSFRTDTPSLEVSYRRSIPVLAVIAAFIIFGLAVVAVFAPWIAPYNPNAIDLTNINAGASWAHLLGTDYEGRDLLSRLIWGSRTSLLGPLLIVSISSAIGVTIALVGGWFGGVIDWIIARSLDVVFAFPGVLLVVLAASVYGPSLAIAIAALVIVYIPYKARITRSAVIVERAQPYVRILELQGVSSFRISVRHILPNVLPIIFTQMVISFGFAMVDLAGISYLGLGVQPPTADWGVLVSDGQANLLEGHPAESLYAGLMIVLVVICFTVIGERLSGGARAIER